MTKDVSVSLNSVHYAEEEEKMSVVSFGKMTEEDDSVYIEYEDSMLEYEGNRMVKNVIAVEDGKIDIIKYDEEKTHLTFIDGENTVSYYSTPIGELEVVLHTRKLNIDYTNDGLNIELEYAVQIAGEMTTDANVSIEVKEVKNA